VNEKTQHQGLDRSLCCCFAGQRLPPKSAFISQTPVLSMISNTQSFVSAPESGLCPWNAWPRLTSRVVAPIAQWLRIGSRMQEVRGSSPRLGGLGVSPFKASGGMNTLPCRASGLQSTTQGNSMWSKPTPSQTSLRRLFVCPHRCALAPQNAQHSKHLFKQSV